MNTTYQNTLKPTKKASYFLQPMARQPQAQKPQAQVVEEEEAFAGSNPASNNCPQRPKPEHPNTAYRPSHIHGISPLSHPSYEGTTQHTEVQIHNERRTSKNIPQRRLDQRQKPEANPRRRGSTAMNQKLCRNCGMPVPRKRTYFCSGTCERRTKGISVI